MSAWQVLACVVGYIGAAVLFCKCMGIGDRRDIIEKAERLRLDQLKRKNPCR